jgi:hypothetical protein
MNCGMGTAYSHASALSDPIDCSVTDLGNARPVQDTPTGREYPAVTRTILAASQ